MSMMQRSKRGSQIRELTQDKNFSDQLNNTEKAEQEQL